MGEPVSLKANGLRLVGGLDCPEGGSHDIPMVRLGRIADAGGGSARCLKCNALLEIEAIPKEG